MSRKLQIYTIVVLFLAVPLTLLVVFTYYPIVRGIFISFTRYNLLLNEAKWVGLRNYIEIFKDEEFYIALKNILRYLLVVPLIQFSSILLAILVNQNIPGIGFFRTMFYVPVITGAVIVSIAWKWIFHIDGILNQFLLHFHIIREPIAWLSDSRYALYCAMFVTYWRGLGYYMVIYLAGLQNIPVELYEAARIDGANSRQIFFRITLPLLKPTILFCFIISSLAALKIFEEVYLLTQGGAETTTMMYLIYDYAFNRYKFGESTALSVIFSGILLVFTFLNFKLFGTRREVHE